MMPQTTAEIFSAFLYGAASMVMGGFLLEVGKRYVKTIGSNLFKGKIEALPFFFVILVFGLALQRLDPVLDSAIKSFPPLTRLGIMVVGSMILFNHSIDNFKYTDSKSLLIYAVGVVLLALPFF